jgi:bacterioferritin (cytochrome b1)
MLDPTDPRLIRLLSYYRDAELHGAGLLLHMTAMEDDPRSLVSLTRHIADESRHAALITQRIADLGGAPQQIRDGYQRRMARAGGVPRTLLELYAATRVAEERAQARYTAHLSSAHVDPETATLLRTINGDEVWHLAWVAARLRELAASEGEDRVEAALRRFHDADAVVSTDLAAMEREVFGFSFSDTPLPPATLAASA